MSLHTLLCKREEEKRPIRIGMVGAGRYGAMFLAQSRFIPGMDVYGVADLNLEKARGACVSAGWPKESVILSNGQSDMSNQFTPRINTFIYRSPKYCFCFSFAMISVLYI